MKAQDLDLHRLDLKYAHLRADDSRRASQLVASIAEHGQQSPVLVIPAEENHFVLIDGYRRVNALSKLHHDIVRALVLEMNAVDALVLHLTQQRAFTRSALEDGWFLKELVDLHGLSREDIAAKLQRSHSWISRRLALVTDLPDLAQKRVRAGKICAYAASKFLVPLARANRKACLRLVEKIGNRTIGSRDIGKIYTAWRKGNSQQRKRIVEEPYLFLKVCSKITPPKPSVRKKEKRTPLHQDLVIIAAICRRAEDKLHDRLLEDTVHVDQLRAAWTNTTRCFSRLAEALERKLANDRQGETLRCSDPQGQGTRGKEDRSAPEDFAQLGEENPEARDDGGSANGAAGNSTTLS